MPFCANCGSSVEGQFCTKCGSAIGAAPASAAGGGTPIAPAATATGMSDNVAGALCYLLGLITGILFLVLAPYNQNKFVRFHAFQSIFFNVAWIALWIAVMIVSGIVTAILPFGIGLLFSLVWFVVWLGGLAVWVLLMVKAYQNQKWHLPVVGALADKQA